MDKYVFSKFINGEIIINTQTEQEFLDLLNYIDKNTDIKWYGEIPMSVNEPGYTMYKEDTCLRCVGECLNYEAVDFYSSGNYGKIFAYEDLLSSEFLSELLRDFLLENFVDESGDLYITGLDFSKFNGNVHISKMIVKGNLFQSEHSIGGNLYQRKHKVDGNLYQTHHKVDGDLQQGYQEVELDYGCTDINYGGECCFDEPQKILQEITKEQLAEIGYKLNV